jgi:hypothetical protein
MKIARFKNITILLTIFIVVSSCDKDQDIYGCTDIEATNYLEEVNIDDDNCLYMYVIEYEVKKYSNQDWDPWGFVDADLQLIVKKVATNEEVFISQTINNASPFASQLWTAPEQLILDNQIWSWQLWDVDNPPLDANDFIAEAEFNPWVLAVNGQIHTLSNDQQTEIIIHYTLK